MTMGKKKRFTVTIPTIGYVVYVIKADDEDDAKVLVADGGGKCVEENSNDWSDPEEWEIVASEDE